jgi:hypothetical protein
VMDKSNSSFEPRKERIRDCDKRGVKFAISWYWPFQCLKYKMWIDFVTNVRWMCCPKQSHSRNKYPDACLSHVAVFLKRMGNNSCPWTKKFPGRVPIARTAQQRSQQHYQLMFKWSSAVLRFGSSIGIRINWNSDLNCRHPKLKYLSVLRRQNGRAGHGALGRRVRMVRLHVMPVRLPFDGRVVKYAVQEITPQSITLLLASLMPMSDKVQRSAWHWIST